MSENEKYILNKEVLEQIAGGGIFSQFNDEEYNAAGVTVVDPGTFVNGGYEFQGQEVSTEGATLLVYFYRTFGRQANSLDEVHEWHKEMIQKYY